MKPDALNRLARTVPVNKVGWCDLLLKNGSLERWITSDELQNLDYAVWILRQDAIVRERGRQVADLLLAGLNAASVASDREERTQHLLRLFDQADFAESRPLFDLYLSLLAKGELDEHRHSDYLFYDLPKKNAFAAVDLLITALDRYVLNGRGKEVGDVDAAFSRITLPEGFIHEAAIAAPGRFVELVLPRVLSLIKTTEVVEEDGAVSDATWPWLTLAFVHDHKASLLEALGDAMAKLAEVGPERFDELTRATHGLPHRNVAFLLLSSWGRNPQRYGDTSIDYILDDLHRLNLGYGMWSTGNGIAAVSRGAISAASAHCSEDRLRKLEAAVMGFFPPVEREAPKRLGYTQSLLLHAIDQRRIGESARKRLQELDRKFPSIDVALPSASTGAFTVESPIPADAAEKMTDDQWIAAMHEYSAQEPHKRLSHDFRLGGASELAHQLEAETRRHKERFARLVVKLRPDISHVYFDALVRGLVAKSGESGPTAADQKPEVVLDAPSDLLFAAIRHIHELPDHPCGRWLCSSISKIVTRELPDDILTIVTFYAANGEQPADSGEQEKSHFGGDLVTYGINTTRGAAAGAIGDLLLADPKRWPKLEGALRAVVEDRSWSVRAVAISCLLSLLNVDRELAVTMFLNTARESPAVLRSMFVARFLFYAVFSHYPALREVLLSMLNDADQTVRDGAARAIAVASFRFREGQEDVGRVEEGDEVCRAALAAIASGNLQFPEYSDRCRGWLITAFNDASRKVHDAASRCFREISDEQLVSETPLIDAFLQSAAFRDSAHTLLFVLEKSVHRLPDVVCKIPERAAEINREENSKGAMEARWWTHQMGSLVLRVYEQTSDPAIRSRCLDALDSMIELDFGNISTELQKLERA